MLKVLKFGGSSMADAKQFAKVRDIVRADDSRRVVVVSAAGKRDKNDHKLTDLLYLCHAHLQYGVSCDAIFEMIRSRYVDIRDELGLKTPLEAEFDALREKMDKGISADELVSRGEYFAAELMADYLGYGFLDSSLWLKFRLDGTVDQAYLALRLAIAERISPDGEEGYPGNLTVSVTYGWSEDNELSIVYEASCDQDTVFSVTSHGYFNLNGEGNGTVLDQELRIDADAITELDDTQCPTGAFLSVEGSPFDFREMKKIGDGIHCDNAQLKLGGTYDHNFVINGDGLREAAVLQSKESGIRLTCFTDQPGVQLYVPCYTLHQKGIDGKDYPPYSAVCLETQHYPNAINIEHFPSVVLKAGENFRSKTLYHFSVMG